MSLVSSFIQDQLLRAVEAEFVSGAPEIQNAIVSEMQAFAGQLVTWAEGKLAGSTVVAPPEVQS